MPERLVARRTQFSSCDACRRSRVACDAHSRRNTIGDPSAPCTRCLNRNRSCTFKWIQDVKSSTTNGVLDIESAPKRKGHRRLRASHSSNDPSGTQRIVAAEASEETSSTRHQLHVVGTSTSNSNSHSTSPASVDLWHNLADSTSYSQYTALPASSTPHHLVLADAGPNILSDVDSKWLQGLYREGFEAVFGSWMGRYSCPFLFEQDGLVEKYVSISDLCCHLDRCMANSAASGQARDQAQDSICLLESRRDTLIEQSLRSTIAAFSARWLPVAASPVPFHELSLDLDNCHVVQTLWRHARRDMLRIINRPSYRSMLSLFLFALTPIPVGIEEDEEGDGISGQACVHAALQQIQTLRARHRNLQFSGSKVSLVQRSSQAIYGTPESADPSSFINAESIAYWAALTFDTSASLTLNCRPLLSSGLFGFESEMHWRLVRTCSKMFDEAAKHWRQGTSEMTDERANQIIAAAASWKLLGWKLAAVSKEAIRDGHDEVEVRKALAAVVDSIKQFNMTFRPHLDECHKRIQFLGQRTKLRWFSLMFHYHLSILMLLDIIEVTDRHDLLVDLEDASTEAENTVMNALAFGVQNTMTLRRASDSNTGNASQRGGVTSGTNFNVPLISIDPYPHHVVAGVQLMRKAIDRDLTNHKITKESYDSLFSTLERTLGLLPQSSKKAQDMAVSDSPKAAVTLIGAGTQGRRLAHMWSSQGNNVHLVDAQPNQLEASITAIDEFRSTAALDKEVSWGQVITHSPESLASALQKSWLVVECVPEQLPLKKRVISELDELAPDDTIIASNSSSYSCGEILDGLTLRNERRFLSAHSYWPPETCEIEIMGHDKTDPSLVALMMVRCEKHGFSPFHVKTQSMGYIYNRIWAAIKREALLAAAEGAASPEEIDAIFKGVLKTPKGPFELMDIVGLDVVLDIENHYAAVRPDIPTESREYLQRYIQRDIWVRKSGCGLL
ncbi:hypothetical protein EDB81DRAFT_864231 [Dactylonectria macrodidyma]|uniref:Zn(2)-C6 fungal-type domain-containing protein n=1 Tax=Dactylonectria macrodidyma TaxID=307937 RepID=A0A9P9FWP7_9HYPO|nr:hypothetical protein EDB81DRAFT_864231 [Dactylonectria macrodidyma]